MGNSNIPVVLVLSIEIILSALPVRTGAQQAEHRPGIEISASGCGILYQSSFATDNFLGVEFAVRNKWGNFASWQAGTRIWFDPVLPELFGRILFTEHIGAWTPAAGIEVGATGSPDFGDGSQLLRETRQAMLRDAGPLYLSSYVAPLSFTFKHDWGLRIAEINFGSHLKNLGRTLRLSISIITISKTM